MVNKFFIPFGTMDSKNTSDLSYYPYHSKLPEAEKLISEYGHKIDPLHSYSHTDLIHTPGSDFKDDAAIKTWNKLHNLAHLMTAPEVNRIYGKSSQLNKLGVHHTLNDALKEVHHEFLAAHLQRELSKKIGVNINDEDFNKELNNVMANSVYRAIESKHFKAATEGFQPHNHKVPLATALEMVRSKAHELGLKGMHDTLQRKSETALILPKDSGVVTMADDKTFSISEASDVLMKATREKIEFFEKEIKALSERELKKALIPSHRHNTGTTSSAGVEDVPAVNQKAESLSKPPVSEAQRAAMGAAASGHSNLGIPKKVGKEFIDADKGGKLPKVKKNALMGYGGTGSGVVAGPTNAPMAMAEMCKGCGGAHDASQPHKVKLPGSNLKLHKAADRYPWTSAVVPPTKKCKAKSSGGAVCYHDYGHSEDHVGTRPGHEKGVWFDDTGEEREPGGWDVKANKFIPGKLIEKTELVDAKGNRSDSGIHPQSELPKDKKSPDIRKPTDKDAGSGGIILPGKKPKKSGKVTKQPINVKSNGKADDGYKGEKLPKTAPKAELVEKSEFESEFEVLEKADRLDIAEGHYHWLANHHKGQGSKEYARLSKLGQKFKPGASSKPESMGEEAKEVYNNLCDKHGCKHPRLGEEIHKSEIENKAEKIAYIKKTVMDKMEKRLAKAKVDTGKPLAEKVRARQERNVRSVLSTKTPTGQDTRTGRSGYRREHELEGDPKYKRGHQVQRQPVERRPGEKIEGVPKTLQDIRHNARSQSHNQQESEFGVHVHSGSMAPHGQILGDSPKSPAPYKADKTGKTYRTPHPGGPQGAHEAVMAGQSKIHPNLPKYELDKAMPPMAKPPSGKSMATAVPVSKPGGMKTPGLGKAAVGMSGMKMPKDMQALASHHAAQGAGQIAPPSVTKMPTPAQHADRASAFQSAMSGAFQPTAKAQPKPSRPGIFGKLHKIYETS